MTFTVWRQCRCKKPYTAEQAEYVLALRDDPGLNKYECPHCGAWHVGHRRET